MNKNYKQDEQQNDELNQQWILPQMIRDINCLCKKIDRYMKDRQIEREKELLKYKKERLKCEKKCKKEQLKHKKEQLKCEKEHEKEQLERKKEREKAQLEHQNDLNKFCKWCEEIHKLIATATSPSEVLGTAKSKTTMTIS